MRDRYLALGGDDASLARILVTMGETHTGDFITGVERLRTADTLSSTFFERIRDLREAYRTQSARTQHPTFFGAGAMPSDELLRVAPDLADKSAAGLFAIMETATLLSEQVIARPTLDAAVALIQAAPRFGSEEGILAVSAGILVLEPRFSRNLHERLNDPERLIWLPFIEGGAYQTFNHRLGNTPAYLTAALELEKAGAVSAIPHLAQCVAAYDQGKGGTFFKDAPGVKAGYFANAPAIYAAAFEAKGGDENAKHAAGREALSLFAGTIPDFFHIERHTVESTSPVTGAERIFSTSYSTGMPSEAAQFFAQGPQIVRDAYARYGILSRFSLLEAARPLLNGRTETRTFERENPGFVDPLETLK
ncbi:MAG: hypothetical protein Q7S65_03610 [Nanoarchaeota archaeon]|nr:hypothetical protein [Nanoarchaeota archaeon]